ncbi:hypothetical protein COBT_000707 [Conglomerata obtusa]
MHKELELVLVNVFHRHGERAPLKLYERPVGRVTPCKNTNLIVETLPIKQKTSIFNFFANTKKQPLNFELIYQSIHDGECAPGQLTDVGKRRLFNLGKKLRKDYVDTGFISSVYNKDEVHLTSTDFQRTIESLQSLIKGLFKVSDTPIPINIGRRGIKSLYSSKFCTSYQIEKEHYHKKSAENNKENLVKIKKYVDQNYPMLNFYKNPYELFDIVRSSIGNGHDYFKNFSSDILQMAEKYSLDRWFDIFHNRKYLAIYKGEIIRDLHDRIKDATQNALNSTKMYVLSAHDVTVYPLLMAFNIHDNRWPDFGANLIFETFKDQNNKHYVRAKYMGKVVPMPGCSANFKNDKSYCSVDDFLRICRDYIPTDKEALCQA